MVRLQLALLASLVGLSVGDGSRGPKYPSYPQPQPYPHYPEHKPSYKEICKLKEWSSDTELCTPTLGPSCDQHVAKVFKVHQSERKCVTLKVPKCKATDQAEAVHLCSIVIEARDLQLQAKLYETESIKRCDTYYQTTCQKAAAGGYGSYDSKPQCSTTPTQNCYDIPVLKTVAVPIKARGSEAKSECKEVLLPTPKTVCWDEEETVCTDSFELKEEEEHLNRCTVTVADDSCENVRLTIPKESCYPVNQPYKS